MLKYIFGTLAVANAFCYWALWSRMGGTQGLEVHFLSVGQGDAQFIESPAGNVLIDGGPSKRVVHEIDKFLDYPDRTIDVVLMTHPNRDHIKGFVDVLKRYDVRLFVMTGVRYDTLPEYQEILALIREKRIPVLYGQRGQEIRFGGPTLQILWPAEVLRDRAYPREKLNDTSIVAKLSGGDFDVLFTGDISAAVERTLADSVGDIEVLKVAHHGSKYSSDANFLRATRPEIAVIGVGKNSYGHPTQEALSRLAAIGARAFRTDLEGSFTVTVQNFKGLLQ